jgi:hypothetical protein
VLSKSVDAFMYRWSVGTGCGGVVICHDYGKNLFELNRLWDEMKRMLRGMTMGETLSLIYAE